MTTALMTSGCVIVVDGDDDSKMLRGHGMRTVDGYVVLDRDGDYSRLAGDVNLRGRIGGARAVLEKETIRMEDFQIALDESIGNLENVDLAEAISRLSEQEAQMQASLAALSRLRQVTLTNLL